MRHVFVLSRDHPWSAWLYGYLVERFQNDSDVEVIIDRRVSERRSVASSRRGLAPERRQSERRRRLGPEEDLRVRSHYIVEL